MPGPAAVVFDNDGLLLDTESVWTRAEEVLFVRRDLDFTLANKQELVGTSAEIAGGILERRLGEPGRAAEIIEELNELVLAELERGVDPMPGATELLAALGEREMRIGLVSNSPRVFIERSLTITGLGGAFHEVLSAHEVAAPKPAPDPYLEVCRRLGVEPAEAIALEDSPDRGRRRRRRRHDGGRHPLAGGDRPRRGPPPGRLARRPGAGAAAGTRLGPADFSRKLGPRLRRSGARRGPAPFTGPPGSP